MINVQDAFYKNFPHLIEKTPKPIINTMVKGLQKILHEETYRKIQEKNHYLTGLDFVESMIEHLNIKYTVESNEIKHIPATGRLIVIANHITGASDAFTLTQLVAHARTNKKVHVVVNGMLMGVTQASDIIIPVDNIKGSISRSSLRAITEALHREEVVIIFPAGVVNRFSYKGLKDSAWKASFLKFAKKTHTPILPVHIEAHNSFGFYLASMVLPRKLSGLLLPREFATTSKRKPLKFHIGKPVPLSAFTDPNIDDSTYVQMFYDHLYQLGTNKKNILDTVTTIIGPQDRLILKEEVEKAQYLGETKDGKRIILVDAQNAPYLIKELGRVREISFRAIGGGTGTAQDNDFYDTYYKHLILWDEDAMEIVGAYRIGECEQIIKERGEAGLYTYNYCTFNEYFNEYHQNSVELGRSFVQPKYWGTRALDTLWQGIGAYLASHPHIRYTYGTVTINAETPPKAVAALVYFYRHHFSCETNMMQAKTPYRFSTEDYEELSSIFDHLSYKEGFTVLKKYLKEMGAIVPTLFKQYAELYEEGAVRFFDFHVNEELHGVVEGFIIADNTRMKPEKRKRYIKTLREREMHLQKGEKSKKIA